jgi:hypothetical protein
MGRSFGIGSFSSRVYTNSFAGINNRAYAPFYFQQKGNSFYGLSKPQYSHQTYYQLAYNGAGMGSRSERWIRSNSLSNISFIPPY